MVLFYKLLKPGKIVFQSDHCFLDYFWFFSLAPLAKKVREQQVLEMTNRLCDKLLNGKEQHRDIASIALKTIVSEVPSSSIARNVLVSISPKLIKGITAPVSCSKLTLLWILYIIFSLCWSYHLLIGVRRSFSWNNFTFELGQFIPFHLFSYMIYE